MSEFTKQEKIEFLNYCGEVARNPKESKNIITAFKKPNSSFDFLFFLERISIAAEQGDKALIKASREMHLEIKAMSKIKSNYDYNIQPQPPTLPAFAFDDQINLGLVFEDPNDPF